MPAISPFSATISPLAHPLSKTCAQIYTLLHPLWSMCTPLASYMIILGFATKQLLTKSTPKAIAMGFFPTQQTHIIPFSIVKQGSTISRADLVWTNLTHCHHTFIVCGVSNVMTAPAWRHQGYGTQLVQQMTTYILNHKVDLGLLFCWSTLVPFYAACGWEAQPQATTRIGTPTQYWPYQAMRMSLFVSAKSRLYQQTLATQPIYLNTIW